MRRARARGLAAAFLLPACLVGCGRMGFDPLGDGSGDGMPAGAFGPGTVVSALASTSQDDDPAVTSDGLELYFTSDRPGGAGLEDIWAATRGSRAEPWPAPTNVSALNSAEAEKAPTVSADGLTLWMERGGEIFVSFRADRASPWSTPALALDDPTFSLGTPGVCDAGRRMYLRMNDAAGVYHIATSTRAATTSSWDPAVVVAELDSNLGDSGPHATEDCQRLYFDSDRSGSLELYVAEAVASTGRFGDPSPLALPGQDPSLTEDERDLVYARSIAGQQEEIFETSR